MKFAIVLFTDVVLILSIFFFPVHAQDNSYSVEKTTQKMRDDTRQKIIQNELAIEKKLFEAAQQALAEATTTKQPTAKLDALRLEVDEYANNLEVLNRELSSLNKQPSTAKESSVRLQGRSISNAHSGTMQPVPFWDVYKRNQVKADDQSAGTSSSPHRNN